MQAMNVHRLHTELLKFHVSLILGSILTYFLTVFRLH